MSTECMEVRGSTHAWREGVNAGKSEDIDN